MRFIGHWFGILILSLINGVMAWFLLDSTFHLGFWVWVGICLIGLQISRAGIIQEQVMDSLTKRR